jgi:WD40 repeat protein
MRIARVAIPVLLAVVACDHPTPPEPGNYGPQGPFDPAFPRQLTFNPGQNLTPAWLPDGSGIIYQFQRLDEADFDRCLGILPPEGGVRRAEICNTNPKSGDSTDAYGAPAVSAGARLFYTRASDFWRLHNAAPEYQSVVVAPLATPLLVDSVRNLPYAVTPGGTMHYGITDVRWLGDSAVIYVAELVVYGSCSRCQDTLRTGLELARMDLRGAPGTVVSIPGTDSASSVALGAGDTIFYTVAGDSRVLRRTLGTGDTATVWDFGAAGVARDVVARGRMLYAVVGGVVAYAHDPSFGPVQRDSGGVIYAVDRGMATDVPIADAARLYRHIALSPDGKRIVAEGYTFRVAPRPGLPPDTVVSPHASLWLLNAP